MFLLDFRNRMLLISERVVVIVLFVMEAICSTLASLYPHRQSTILRFWTRYRLWS